MSAPLSGVSGDPAKYDRKLQTAKSKAYAPSGARAGDSPMQLLDDKDIQAKDPKWLKLGETAMRILMKILYSARNGRYDLQRAINSLGQYVHKWNAECEEDLYRLMCYVQSSLRQRQYAWVGNKAADISPHLYADADFAGCTQSARSTNGVHLCLKGTHTYFPINGISKKTILHFPLDTRGRTCGCSLCYPQGRTSVSISVGTTFA